MRLLIARLLADVLGGARAADGEAARDRAGQAQQLRTGDLQSVVVDSVELLDPLIGRFVPSVYASVLGACTASACIMVIDPLVGAVVLVYALLAPLSELGGARWIKDRGDRWTRAYRCLYAENPDAVQGWRRSRPFGRGRHRLDDPRARRGPGRRPARCEFLGRRPHLPDAMHPGPARLQPHGGTGRATGDRRPLRRGQEHAHRPDDALPRSRQWLHPTRRTRHPRPAASDARPRYPPCGSPRRARSASRRTSPTRRSRYSRPSR